MENEPRIRDHATEFFPDADAIAIEDKIWWAVGRRAILSGFLDAASESGIRGIVEIGCGSGGDLEMLARRARVYGIERSQKLAERARARGVAEAVFADDLFEQPLPGVDLFCMFDVLEHIEDDEDFVRRLHEKGGQSHQLLLTVPACPFLYGPHDRLLHHYRRYSRRALTVLLERHGYELVAINHYMFFLFPVTVIARGWDALRQQLGFRKQEISLGRAPRPINALLIAVLRLEAFLGRWIRLPFGLWLVALARRKAA